MATKELPWVTSLPPLGGPRQVAVGPPREEKEV
eukprot:CAMPEP_0180286782 /NCGR_PEP_ID=MMETSP0988-20121125/12869_1 /TAXON_ID=697907 /ORGANISM="non described non described, Strain CCMP2293" /LENGTH=32 /DNA_ID= /DNA_START= /DNA_END= /DNA_ORIENTATION=